MVMILDYDPLLEGEYDNEGAFLTETDLEDEHTLDDLLFDEGLWS